MTKQEISQRWDQCNQEQRQLAAEVQQKSAKIQQLEGKKQLLSEMHDKILKSETKLEVMPDPPKDEPTQAETPAS